MSVGHPLRADGLHALRALQRPLTQCLRCRAPRQVEELWGAFDKDGSGEIVYHELKAALTPALAPAKPSLQTLDPHNSRADWRYSKRDWESAGSLIERNYIRDVPYSEDVRMHKEDVDAYFLKVRSEESHWSSGESHHDLKRVIGRRRRALGSLDEGHAKGRKGTEGWTKGMRKVGRVRRPGRRACER